MANELDKYSDRTPDPRSGRFQGRVYYSDTLPKGDDRSMDAAYNKRLYDLANYVYYHEGEVPTDSVRVLQDELRDIGYLDYWNPYSHDAEIGGAREHSRTAGAPYRYMVNYGNEAIWENVKSKWNDFWE